MRGSLFISDLQSRIFTVVRLVERRGNNLFSQFFFPARFGRVLGVFFSFIEIAINRQHAFFGRLVIAIVSYCSGHTAEHLFKTFRNCANEGSRANLTTFIFNTPTVARPTALRPTISTPLRSKCSSYRLFLLSQGDHVLSAPNDQVSRQRSCHQRESYQASLELWTIAGVGGI